jgi:uncharacterized repeat protein (TIGR01451 family)
MRRKQGLTYVVVAALVALGLTGCEPGPSPWRSELLSVNAAGTNAGDGGSQDPVFSPDGTKVAFTSSATNLGANDTNLCHGIPPVIPHTPCEDVYLRDLTTGVTTLVSSNAAGTDSGNNQSGNPRFSPDGTKLIFWSEADDLGPVDTVTCGGPAPFPTFSCPDIYMRDLVTGTMSVISVSLSGDAAGQVNDASFSPDGTKVAFTTTASTVVAGDTNGKRDIFVRDLTAGTTTMATQNVAGTNGGNENVEVWLDFTADSQTVVFSSLASDLVAHDTNGVHDVFARNVATGVTTLVSANLAGSGGGNAGSFQINFSGHSVGGDLVAFFSQASDLVATDTNGVDDVFVRDLSTGVTSLVSVNAAGTDSAAPKPGDNDGSYDPFISDDGRLVAFNSGSADLGPPDTGTLDGLYVRDLALGSTEMVSVNAEGTDNANNASSFPVFSPDGTRVAFVSLASDLGAVDESTSYDVYLRDLTKHTTTLVSAGPDGGSTSYVNSNWPEFSPDGTQIAFTSTAALDPLDLNGMGDVYLATLHGSDLALTGTASPEPVAPGGSVTYALHVVNEGPAAAPEISVGFVLPAGATFGSASGECSAPTPSQPRLVVCTVGTLLAGGDYDLSITATVTGGSGSTLTAHARVRSGAIEPAPTDNEVTITSTVS